MARQNCWHAGCSRTVVGVRSYGARLSGSSSEQGLSTTLASSMPLDQRLPASGILSRGGYIAGTVVIKAR